MDNIYYDIPPQNAEDGVNDGSISTIVPSPCRLDDHLWLLFEA